MKFQQNNSSKNNSSSSPLPYPFPVLLQIGREPCSGLCREILANCSPKKKANKSLVGPSSLINHLERRCVIRSEEREGGREGGRKDGRKEGKRKEGREEEGRKEGNGGRKGWREGGREGRGEIILNISPSSQCHGLYVGPFFTSLRKVWF